MEGSYWLRFGLIVAMFLGCLYTLAPTYLGDHTVDTDGFNDATGKQEVEPPLEVWFNTPDGSPDDATAEALEKRLKAAGVVIERVFVKDDRLIVDMVSGTDKADVLSRAGSAGRTVSLYAPGAVGIDAAALAAAEDAATLVRGVVSSATKLDGEPLGVTVAASSAAEGVAITVDGTLPADLAYPIVAVDGVVVGHVDGAVTVGAPAPVVARPDGKAALEAATQSGGSLPEALTHVVLEKAEMAEVVEKAEAAPPEWWEPLLPNTKLSLGLDLQGGIDLTLQVDLEAAVFSQVQRDQADLKDQIERDGRETRIYRERSRPAVKVYDKGDFADVQAYLNKYLGDYDYVESDTDDRGSFHVYQISDTRADEITSGAVEQVLETLRKRVNSTGVKEPSIVKMGGGRINVQLPGVENAQQATDAIGTQAILQFRLVDEETDQNLVNSYVTEAEKALPPGQFKDDDIVNDWLHRQGKVPEDRLVRFQYEETAPGVFERRSAYQLYDRVELTGSDVNDAYSGLNQNREPEVIMAFKSRGKRKFCEITTENVNKRFAIILDEQIRSAPNIRSPICGGSASISMGNAMDAKKDADTLALVLRTGSLTAPVDTGEVREIGASLGEDAVTSGVWGSLIGGFLTLTIMGIWYGKPGLIADVALVLNVLLVFALLATFGATLTLPGIAGVALTVGMAVDANIIVYERIREELKLGVAARKAVDTGYEKAVVAVLDANITTAIAGVVLYSYGTGPIKGFAVTLLVGIFTTLVTALFVTRTFMEMLTRNSSARLRI